VDAPAIPEEVVAADLPRGARSRLRTLARENADVVARHLVMVGRLLEDEPELAFAHAQEAVRRAARVDVVREAAGISAYRTGRYAEALRELRTARRLSGSNEHVPMMADCERGLGRPERALALAEEHVGALDLETQIEMAIVVSGARLDLGDPEAALAVLGTPLVRSAVGPTAWRVAEARAEALRACGRNEEAKEALTAIPEEAFGPEDIVVVDLADGDLAGAEGGLAEVARAEGGLVDVPEAEGGFDENRVADVSSDTGGE
jgi:tetratricopeptide (TPR) repeat protein